MQRLLAVHSGGLGRRALTVRTRPAQNRGAAENRAGAPRAAAGGGGRRDLGVAAAVSASDDVRGGAAAGQPCATWR